VAERGGGRKEEEKKVREGSEGGDRKKSIENTLRKKFGNRTQQ